MSFHRAPAPRSLDPVFTGTAPGDANGRVPTYSRAQLMRPRLELSPQSPFAYDSSPYPNVAHGRRDWNSQKRGNSTQGSPQGVSASRGTVPASGSRSQHSDPTFAAGDVHDAAGARSPTQLLHEMDRVAAPRDPNSLSPAPHFSPPPPLQPPALPPSHPGAPNMFDHDAIAEPLPTRQSSPPCDGRNHYAQLQMCCEGRPASSTWYGPGRHAPTFAAPGRNARQPFMPFPLVHQAHQQQQQQQQQQHRYAVPHSASAVPYQYAPHRGKVSYSDRCGYLVEERDAVSGNVVATYRCGALLGVGGFAKVFDFQCTTSGDRFACKLIDKAKLTDSNKREKFFAEVDVHRRLRHANILQFVRTFQDEHYHYILLERCCKQSLMEVSKQRKAFQLEEVQHIMLQLVSAVEYLHARRIIHRDLKLGNVMIDGEGTMKIGDFGFATELATAEERKRTMCGTPNYIAPEVLTADKAQHGYSYEADIWSLGVILYALAVGTPPFETTNINLTYHRIKAVEYSYPPHAAVGDQCRDLIDWMLQRRPEARPKLVQIRNHAFFRSPPAPRAAPLSLVSLDADISPPSSLAASPLAAPQSPLDSSPQLCNRSPSFAPPSLPSLAPAQSSPPPPAAAASAPIAAPYSKPPLPSVASADAISDKQHYTNRQEQASTSNSAATRPCAAAPRPAAPLSMPSSAHTSSSLSSAESKPRVVAPPAPLPVASNAKPARHHTAPTARQYARPHPPEVVVSDSVSFPKYGYAFTIETISPMSPSSSSSVVAAVLNDKTKIVYDAETDAVWYFSRMSSSAAHDLATRAPSPRFDGCDDAAAGQRRFFDELHFFSPATPLLDPKHAACQHTHPFQSAAQKKLTIARFLQNVMSRGGPRDENPVFKSAIADVPRSELCRLFAEDAQQQQQQPRGSETYVVYAKTVSMATLAELVDGARAPQSATTWCNATRFSNTSFQVSIVTHGRPVLRYAPRVHWCPSGLDCWKLDLVLYGDAACLIAVADSKGLVIAATFADVAQQSRLLVDGSRVFTPSAHYTGLCANASVCTIELPEVLVKACAESLRRVGCPTALVQVISS